MKTSQLPIHQANDLYISLLNKFYNKEYLSRCAFEGETSTLPENTKRLLSTIEDLKINKSRSTINCFQEHSRPLGMHDYECKNVQTLMLCPTNPIIGGRLLFFKRAVFDPHYVQYSKEDMDPVSFQHGRLIKSEGSVPRIMEYIESAPSPVLYISIEQNE